MGDDLSRPVRRDSFAVYLMNSLHELFRCCPGDDSADGICEIVMGAVAPGASACSPFETDQLSNDTSGIRDCHAMRVEEG